MATHYSIEIDEGNYELLCGDHEIGTYNTLSEAQDGAKIHAALTALCERVRTAWNTYCRFGAVATN